MALNFPWAEIKIHKKSPNHLSLHSDNSLKIKNVFPCVFPAHCLPHSGQYHTLKDQVADSVITWQSWHKTALGPAFPTQLRSCALGTAQAEPDNSRGWGCPCQPWALLAPLPPSLLLWASVTHGAPGERECELTARGGRSKHPKQDPSLQNTWQIGERHFPQQRLSESKALPAS